MLKQFCIHNLEIASRLQTSKLWIFSFPTFFWNVNQHSSKLQFLFLDVSCGCIRNERHQWFSSLSDSCGFFSFLKHPSEVIVSIACIYPHLWHGLHHDDGVRSLFVFLLQVAKTSNIIFFICSCFWKSTYCQWITVKSDVLYIFLLQLSEKYSSAHFQVTLFHS